MSSPNVIKMMNSEPLKTKSAVKKSFSQINSGYPLIFLYSEKYSWLL